MTSSTTPLKQPSWSSGDEDNTALQESLKQQLSLGWRLTPNGMGLEKTFRFKTFKNTWAFMNAVAEDCKSNKHHPEWSNVSLLA
jgi:4a-hydroxytetrahydrobiopterin dehydratase